jgi:hypothetical protein
MISLTSNSAYPFPEAEFEGRPLVSASTPNWLSPSSRYHKCRHHYFGLSTRDICVVHLKTFHIKRPQIKWRLLFVLVVSGNGATASSLSVWWPLRFLPWGPFCTVRRDQKRNLVSQALQQRGAKPARTDIVPQKECQFTRARHVAPVGASSLQRI